MPRANKAAAIIKKTGLKLFIEVKIFLKPSQFLIIKKVKSETLINILKAANKILGVFS